MHPLLSGLARGLMKVPAPRERPVIHGDAPVFPRGRPFTVVTWNLQFCGSRRYRFFYDGGRQVSVPREVVEQTATEIAAAIRTFDADFVLLQEVDRRSRRTRRIDEAARIVADTGHPTWTSTPYHRHRFVPHPWFAPLGRVGMELVTLSRWRLATAARVPLPLLRESAVRRAFNLRRAALTVTCGDGAAGLTLINTHLSAFSRGDGTLDRQVATLQGLLAGNGGPWVLAGDMNALPPGDTASRLPDPEEYPEAVTPITPLLAWRSTWDAGAFAAHPKRFYTYLPPGADAPDRTLDWVIYDGPRLLSWEIPDQFDALSDHRPIVARFGW